MRSYLPDWMPSGQSAHATTCGLYSRPSPSAMSEPRFGSVPATSRRRRGALGLVAQRRHERADRDRELARLDRREAAVLECVDSLGHRVDVEPRISSVAVFASDGLGGCGGVAARLVAVVEVDGGEDAADDRDQRDERPLRSRCPALLLMAMVLCLSFRDASCLTRCVRPGLWRGTPACAGAPGR